MPVYTASFFALEHHHGKVFSVSRTTPKDLPEGVQITGTLPFLQPTQKLLTIWKHSPKDAKAWEGYKATYKQETIVPNLPQIYDWIDGLNPTEDLTLCCWEAAGNYCHRNLVARLIEHRRPDCFGGCDVPRSTAPERFSWLAALEGFLETSDRESLEAWNQKYAGTCAYEDCWGGLLVPPSQYDRILAIRDGRQGRSSNQPCKSSQPSVVKSSQIEIGGDAQQLSLI